MLIQLSILRKTSELILKIKVEIIVWRIWVKKEVKLTLKSYLCIDLTFNQLLAKYGYIEDESMSKKDRKREWHVKKIKDNYSDGSSSEDFWISCNYDISSINYNSHFK